MPVGVEITADNLAEPVLCQHDEWNSKLQFRLGHRVLDLYCLKSQSTHPECPAQLADRALAWHPECATSVEEFQRRKSHLAFFPFDSDHPILGYGAELLLWSVLMAAALLGTAIWLFRAIRTPNMYPGQ